jgi:hypothetical protein
MQQVEDYESPVYFFLALGKNGLHQLVSYSTQTIIRNVINKLEGEVIFPIQIDSCQTLLKALKQSFAKSLEPSTIQSSNSSLFFN